MVRPPKGDIGTVLSNQRDGVGSVPAPPLRKPGRNDVTATLTVLEPEGLDPDTALEGRVLGPGIPQFQQQFRVIAVPRPTACAGKALLVLCLAR